MRVSGGVGLSGASAWRQGLVRQLTRRTLRPITPHFLSASCGGQGEWAGWMEGGRTRLMGAWGTDAPLLVGQLRGVGAMEGREGG